MNVNPEIVKEAEELACYPYSPYIAEDQKLFKEHSERIATALQAAADKSRREENERCAKYFDEDQREDWHPDAISTVIRALMPTQEEE